VGVIFLVIWLARTLRSGGREAPLSARSGPSPKEILQARYARGEIDREQYQQILSDLE
jgi:putative membrane protein